MLLTLTRNVLLVVPGVLLLARFGAVGVFAAQPLADVVCLVLVVVILVQLYRRYPPQALPAVAMSFGNAPST